MNDSIDSPSELSPESSQTWLNRLAAFLLREPQDKEQLVELLRDAEHRHLLAPESLAMIEGVLQVSVMQVRDIMIPRPQMIVIHHDDAPNELLAQVIESGHSRFPVIGETRDEVIGILLAKDLLKFTFTEPAEISSTPANAKESVDLKNPAASIKDPDNTPQPSELKSPVCHKKSFDLKKIIRPGIFVPESKRCDTLLKEFRLKRNHMAIVVNEYGDVSGLVTIEDVLEQIVGEIEDEYDVEDDSYIKRHTRHKFIVKALTPLEEFNDYFKTDFSDEMCDTIGGLVMRSFEHLPKRGEAISIENYHFKVLHADNRRIRLLQVKKENGKDRDQENIKGENNGN